MKQIALILFCIVSLTVNAQESEQFKQVRKITDTYLKALNNYVSNAGDKSSITNLFDTSSSTQNTPIMAFYGNSLSIGIDQMLLDYKTGIKNITWDADAIDPFYGKDNILKTQVAVTYTYLKDPQDENSLVIEKVQQVFEFKQIANYYKIVSILNPSFLASEGADKQLSVDKTTIDFGICESGSLQSAEVELNFGEFESGDKFTIRFYPTNGYSVYFRNQNVRDESSFDVLKSKEIVKVFFKPTSNADLTKKIVVVREEASVEIALNGRLSEKKIEKPKEVVPKSDPIAVKPQKTAVKPNKDKTAVKLGIGVSHLYDLQEGSSFLNPSYGNLAITDIDLQGLNGDYTKFDFGFSAILELPANKNGSFVLSYTNGTMTSQKENQYANAKLQIVNLTAKKYLVPHTGFMEPAFRPFMELGLGVTNYIANRYFVLDEGLFSQTSGNSISSTASMGFQIKLSSKVKLSLASNFILNFSDAIDGYDSKGQDIMLNNSAVLLFSL